MKQRRYGLRPVIPRQGESACVRCGLPFALRLVPLALLGVPLALLGACMGGAELHAQSARPAQLEGAKADTPPETLPASWKPAREQAWGEPRAQRGTQNLFVELLGKSQAEVDEKLQTAVGRFFGTDGEEPAELVRDSGYRVYYELPQDPSMAFIWAADSNDVRSEGMSYGMMLAVQMNRRAQFDRLWKFAHTYMQFPGDSPLTAWRHYFRWQGTVRVERPQSWSVEFSADTTPAPDGEEYFAAALYLADRRWGSGGDVNYRQEAARISWAMLHNRPSREGRFPIINGPANMVVFVPYQSSNDHSDPSYHLPAFYELFAEYGPSEDAERWREVTRVSREFLVTSAHPTTGLHPDYALFDGKPTQGYQSSRHDEFYYDAWRVPLNMALDQAWFKAEPKLKVQLEKYHSFFTQHLGEADVSAALFKLDGTSPSGGGSTALTATLAAGALVSGASNRKAFVQNLWRVDQQSGRYRYYQQCVYLLGLLATAGHFQYDWASTESGDGVAAAH